VEDLLAVARELHQHDWLAGVRIDVRARPRELQVGAGHLRDAAVALRVRQAVLEQVERLAACDLLRADAVALGRVAADDDRVLRDAEDRRRPFERALLLLLGLLERRQQILRRHRPRDHTMVRVEQVPLRRRAAVGERARLRRIQQPVEAPRRDRHLLQPRCHRRAGQVRLEVVELQDGRLADQLRGRGRVVHARELDHDLVRALLADLRLRDAELVDPVPHDVDRAGQVVCRQRVALRRVRLQHHLEAALEVQAEGRLAVDGRAGNGEQGDADESRDDAAEQREVSTPV
jgi:hypothetical protein